MLKMFELFLKIYILQTPIIVRFSPSGTEFSRPEINNVVFEKFTRLAAMLDLVWAGSAKK